MAKGTNAQMVAGKAFEYALLAQFEEKLRGKTTVVVKKNSSYDVAKSCYDKVSSTEQSEYMLTASFAVNFLIDLEPRLQNNFGKKDILELEIQTDEKGKGGDVRDVLAIRLVQKWEIGVSAKNNHNAAKHSRLSEKIDFGKQWLKMDTSAQYFKTVTPIFRKLERHRKESGGKKQWNELGNYHDTIYVPVLQAFIKELKRLYRADSKKVARNLVTYLVGNKDFYKVIKRKKSVEIHAYNLYGTLNLSFKDCEPKYKTSKIPLPTKIISATLKKGSDTTAIVTMDNDWSLSFRIHNASSKIESSLKFDVVLLKSPKKLFKNKLSINHKQV